ncbi:site-2 protease family protein [Actinoplanes sp. NPDC023714]|uniref:site-2 protease family protein n=1 Tax=Actinoplanes sp. NPDC023714 TaxID=3154322 RepID=UPI0033D70068
MRQTIRLGRIHGIPVGVHWSVLLILAFLIDGLAVTLLPTAVPGYPVAAYWLTAAWIAVLLLIALTGHELAHALTAQRFGIGVDSITLWALGGVSVIDDTRRRPRTEMLVALAGPAFSLALAAMFAAMSFPARLLSSDLLPFGFAWLAGANVVLALFNSLPGAPLDGGRILAAALWWLRGDRVAAQRIAAWSGMVLGLALSGLGLILLLGSATTTGLWFVLLGWYLVVAARSEQNGTELAALLHDVRAGDAMSAPAVCGYTGHTVAEFAAGTARFCPHRAYPVIDIDGLLAGMVTTAGLAAVPAELRSTTRLTRIMIPAARLACAEPDAPVLDVISDMNNRLRTLVIVDQGRPCGVLTAGDIARVAGVTRLGVLPAERRSADPAA